MNGCRHETDGVGAGADVRAHGFGIVPISQRGRIGVALDGRVVYDLVNFVRCDAWPDRRRGKVQNLARELHTTERPSAKKLQ